MGPARPTRWRPRPRVPGCRSSSSPTMATRRAEPSAPVYRHGVLCIDAVEISTDHGHVLALGLPRMPFVVGGAGRDVLEDIARFGGDVDPGASDVRAAVAAVDRRRRRLRRRRMAERRQRVARRARAGAGASRLDLLAPAGGEPRARCWIGRSRRWACGIASSGMRAVVGVAAADAHARMGLASGGGAVRRAGPVARLPELRIELPDVLADPAGAAPHRHARRPTRRRRWRRFEPAEWSRCSTPWPAPPRSTSRRRTRRGRRSRERSSA